MATQINPEIVPPSQALAAFRAGRLLDSIKEIPIATQAFDGEVKASLSGTRPTQESVKALMRGFVRSYRTLSEANEAAENAGVINGKTSDVLDSIMAKLKHEFKVGIESMSNNLEHLNHHSPGAFGDFCSYANDRLQRMQQFWTQVYETAPKAPKMTL